MFQNQNKEDRKVTIEEQKSKPMLIQETEDETMILKAYEKDS